ncbi:Uu.00g030750.m01.CDS01 [Anthostomella pinea]|uniref:Uu.00g030750.m01.CDS01 n=1 Tax=Anthostomella pinea TaxID=933095 RepID=A0AAI8YD08_9PEZI|nr:Uu.00g030750.m01.CDS01 [Anthostomella pinea]
MAAAEPPSHIKTFYEQIQSKSRDVLVQQPYYIDPRASPIQSPLCIDLRKASAFQDRWYDIQGVFFDFAGRCVYCAGSGKHPHSVQADGIRAVEGFPGLHIYPRLFCGTRIHSELIDELLHNQLANPANRTNLHADYSVVYPMSSTNAEEEQAATAASFFSPAASRLQMLSHSHEIGATPPIGIRQFVQKLRWFTVGKDSEQVSQAEAGDMPARIRDLLEYTLQFRPEAGTVHVSSADGPFDGLGQGKKDGNQVVNVSLGCDGIFVVAYESGELPPPPLPTYDDESWQRDFITGLSSSEEEDEGSSKPKAKSQSSRPPTSPPVETKSNEVEVSPNTNGTRYAAIHVRSGDVLVLSGSCCREACWYGVAKVFPGTFEAWQDWPRWPWGTNADRQNQDLQGCMKGMKLDLFVR